MHTEPARYEGDFCYSLPGSDFIDAPGNQEKKMKTTRSSAPQPGGKAATPVKTATRRSRATLQSDSPSSAIECPREQMIAEAAYFRAERRGFMPGNEMSDWLEAEADVEHLLSGRQ